MRLPSLAAASLLCFSLAGCSDADETKTPLTPSDGIPVEPGVWQMVELPGAICGKGSQYRFFVNDSPSGSSNVLVMLEGGGACWDFESCSGKTSLGASNTDGITEGHMALWGSLFPMLHREDETNPVRDFNFVYLPYCTGDVHIGNNVVTYVDPTGKEPDLVFHHNGYKNSAGAAEFTAKRYPKAPRLVVTGCSAGGVGSISTHYVFRKAIAPERAYLLDDSGPVFPGTAHSQPLYDKITEAWGMSTVFADLPFPIDAKDLGNLPLKLADELPDDRLSITYFLRDHTFTAYSYKPFFPEQTEEDRLAFWKDDTDLLTASFDKKENLAYYLPYWRARIDSHCTTPIDYVGTEIQEAGVDLSDFIENLLDDGAPLKSYRESPQSGEDGTP